MDWFLALHNRSDAKSRGTLNGGKDADDGLTFAIFYRSTQRIQKAEEA
jgi:hypothetical protein